MKTLRLEASSGASEILLGGRLEELDRLLPRGRCIVVTDPNVRRAWGHLLEGREILEIGLGEESKTLATVEGLYRAFVAREVDRSTFLLAVGGGIVCDVAGFAASTYMRGLDFGFVATTLLAQVDASVGGKNGVNFQGFKNLVGVFRQPRFVLCDFHLLSTLPEREYACGLAEMVKVAAIASSDLFEWMESNVEPLLARDGGALERAVAEAVSIKADLVRADEREQGARKKLNFGHTLGHALERGGGLLHGEAVSLGMVAAARLSVAQGGLPAPEAERLVRLLERLGLPVKLGTADAGIAEGLAMDKKRRGSCVDVVLLERLGTAVVRPLALDFLREALL